MEPRFCFPRPPALPRPPRRVSRLGAAFWPSISSPTRRLRHGSLARVSASARAATSSKSRRRLGLHSSIPRGASCCQPPPVFPPRCFVLLSLRLLLGARRGEERQGVGGLDGVHGPRPTGFGPGRRPGVRGARHPGRGGVARGQLPGTDDGVRIRWEGPRAGLERRHQFLFHRYGWRV